MAVGSTPAHPPRAVASTSSHSHCRPCIHAVFGRIVPSHSSLAEQASLACWPPTPARRSLACAAQPNGDAEFSLRADAPALTGAGPDLSPTSQEPPVLVKVRFSVHYRVHSRQMLFVGGSEMPFGWSFLSIARVPMIWSPGDIWTAEVCGLYLLYRLHITTRWSYVLAPRWSTSTSSSRSKTGPSRKT